MHCHLFSFKSTNERYHLSVQCDTYSPKSLAQQILAREYIHNRNIYNNAKKCYLTFNSHKFLRYYYYIYNFFFRWNSNHSMLLSLPKTKWSLTLFPSLVISQTRLSRWGGNNELDSLSSFPLINMLTLNLWRVSSTRTLVLQPLISLVSVSTKKLHYSQNWESKFFANKLWWKLSKDELRFEWYFKCSSDSWGFPFFFF